MAICHSQMARRAGSTATSAAPTTGMKTSAFSTPRPLPRIVPPSLFSWDDYASATGFHDKPKLNQDARI
jgi:hypothetical protein